MLALEEGNLLSPLRTLSLSEACDIFQFLKDHGAV